VKQREKAPVAPFELEKPEEKIGSERLVVMMLLSIKEKVLGL